MRAAILGFAAGAGWLQTRAELPAAWLLALLVLGCVLLARGARSFSGKRRATALAACGVLAGFAWAALMAHWYLREQLPDAWEGRDITVVGTIDSLPHRFDRGIRFQFAVEQVLAADGADASEGAELPALPSRLALSWYGGFRGEQTQTVPGVLPGERWQLTLRLKRPHGNANPHGFDYEVWLLEQGVRATGYVRPDQRAGGGNRKLDDFVPGFSHAVERSRHWLRERIVAALPDAQYAGVIVALVVGDQRAIAQSDWEVFNRTGIGHLISISGLHITMVAGMFAGVFGFFWRRSFFTRAQLPLLLPAQKAAALAAVAMALLYVLLAGFGVPAQRTLYMIMVVAAALWFDRMTSVSHVLCLALGVVILLDPWAVLWPGFWLSFGAVAAILYAGVGRARPAPADMAGRPGAARVLASLREAGRTQYAVTLGLVPLTMLLFGQVSLVSPLANALAIPLISFVVTPLALLGSILPAPLSDWVLQAAHGCVAWLAQVMAWLAAKPAAVWHAPLPPWWVFAAALVGTSWLLAPRGWPRRWLGLAGWLPLLLQAPSAPPPGELHVTAFDVGQGTALLLETPRRRLLYDTGPAYSPESDGGSRVILPYLKARGITRLDGMIVSHGDVDHAGGALSLLAGVRVDWLLTSLDEAGPVARAAAVHRRCQAGQAWEWDGMRFEMLHPSPASYDNPRLKPNARSCTLKVTHGGQSILLAGDIERHEEAVLVAEQGARLQSTVLLAPHHGSGTSSTRDFLQAVNPRLALFQVGYRNRYHHPKSEVYERYGELGIYRVRSDESGAVTLRFGDTLQVDEYRGSHARYWYGR